MIAASLAGWGVARNGLRPVRRLTDAAEDIARTEKLDPIEVEGNDEIARLARAFNAMLAALSASRDRQRQLVADAGHELRTPLTSLRTNLDLLTQADRQGGLSEASRAELLDDVRFQIEELTTLIGDLTELARDEPDAVRARASSTSRRSPSAPSSGSAAGPAACTSTCTPSPGGCHGDSAALERAVTNLLDNAAKWSPPLGTVTVRLTDGTLQVSDQGHGIAESDLPHVFDRFYRSPESRTMPGSGLGLSIVRQVAERHGGRSGWGGQQHRAAPAFWFEVPGSAQPPHRVSHGDVPGHSQWALSLSRTMLAVGPNRTRTRAPLPDDTTRIPDAGVRRVHAPLRHGSGDSASPTHQEQAPPTSHAAVPSQRPGRRRRCWSRPSSWGHSADWPALPGLTGSTAGPVTAPAPGVVLDRLAELTGRRPARTWLPRATPSRRSPRRCCPPWSRSTCGDSRERAPGPGSCISSDGEILTNNHVVEVAGQGGEMSVNFNDGTAKKATVVGTDPLTDLAVIKAEGVSGLTPATHRHLRPGRGR